MSLPQTMAESPTGLIHIVGILNASSYARASGVTRCGRDVNWDTWTRIQLYDEAMFGKGIRAIRAMVSDSNVCDRCFK